MEQLSSEDRDAVGRLQALVRVPSVSGKGVRSGSYAKAVKVLQTHCELAGLGTQIIEITPGKPILLATALGSNLELGAILLSGHYDVVPVDPEKWTQEPFSAKIVEGFLYGRGVQDMKCVLASYIEVMRRLKAAGKVLKRTVHLSFVPDEEIGGREGMEAFVQSDAFQRLNVAFALDEGLASENAEIPVFYGERAVWWLWLRSEGSTGHSSRFLSNNASTLKLHRSLENFIKFRKEQVALFEAGFPIGEIASVNITALQAGHSSDGGQTFALNVVPSTAEAGIDMRLPPSMDLKELQLHCESWAGENGVTCKRLVGSLENPTTSVDPDKSIWWKAFSEACKRLDLEVKPQIFPAATDSRFLRRVGIPSLGFSPLPNTPILLHDHDERLDINIYIDGLKTYAVVIEALATVE